MRISLRLVRRATLGTLLLTAAFLVLLPIGQAVARPTAFGLVHNGDAEADLAPTADADVVTPNGWQTTGAFSVEPYGTRGFPDSPDNGGANLFAGGSGSAVSTASQDVDVSASAAEIDAGSVKATLSALLGGWETQEDAARVRAVFLDSSGVTTLGSFTIGPVTASDRGGKTMMLARSATSVIPAKTRTIRVVITAQRASGIFNDGYVDNVALSLSAAKLARGHFAFALRVFDRTSALSAGTSGTFATRGQPNSGGEVSVVKVSAKDLKLSWRYRGSRYSVVLGFRNGGTYDVAASILSLRVLVKSSNAPGCRKGTSGLLGLDKPGDVSLAFCADRVDFMAPNRASGWIEQR
jgi:hypothetical protein